jgi:large subunit ribosomal protein L23
MDPSQVIIRPVVSEKSYVLATADKYTVPRPPDAHKTQIRQAVEQLFDVHVVASARSRSAPSPSAAGSPAAARGPGRRPSCRCAPGETIPIFQGLQGLEG